VASQPAEQLEAGPEPAGGPAESEVWQLLGRADVVVRGVLEAQDRGERRLWEERARLWLQDLSQAWLRSQRRPW